MGSRLLSMPIRRTQIRLAKTPLSNREKLKAEGASVVNVAREKYDEWRFRFSDHKLSRLLTPVAAICFVVACFYAVRIMFFFDTVAQLPDMSGDTILITGGSSGFGLQLAKSVAAANASVILASRSKTNLEIATHEILKVAPNAKVKLCHLDLAKLDSVENCAKRVLQLVGDGKLSCLVNNAAIFKPTGDRDPLETVDGFDRSFQVNFLGHYLLTELLKEKIAESEGRIVSVMCDSLRDGMLSLKKDEKMSTFKNADKHATRVKNTAATAGKELTLEEKRDFAHNESYMQAKLCLYMMMVKWAKDFEGSKAVSIGVDTGVSTQTLFNRYTRRDFSLKGQSKKLLDLFYSWRRPGLENSVQTLTSVTGCPEFYAPEFNGKVLFHHSAEHWDTITGITAEEAGEFSQEKKKPNFMSQIREENKLQRLDTIASRFTQLDERKSSIKSLRQSLKTESDKNIAKSVILKNEEKLVALEAA